MNRKAWILLLCWPVFAFSIEAQSWFPKLSGIVTVSGTNYALLGNPCRIWVAEGETFDKLKVTSIDPKAGEVAWSNAGKPGGDSVPPVRSQSKPPTLNLRDSRVTDILEVYAILAGRSALISPGLTDRKLTVEFLSEPGPDQIAAALREELLKNGIKIVPREPLFFLAYPREDESWLKIQDAPSSRATVKPDIGVCYPGTPLGQVVPFYASVSGKSMQPLDPGVSPVMTIHFRSNQLLTRAEFQYAIEALLSMAKLEIISVDAKQFKVVPLKTKREPAKP